MAKDILYIRNGVISTNHIEISGDGVSWDAISKVGLTVTVHSINLNSSAKNSYPERNKESGFVITIRGLESEGAILKFNPNNVVNQPTWIAGTDVVNSQVALASILSWLA